MANELRGTDSKDIGIRVEVGQLEAAIDLRLVAEYGSSIPKIAEHVRDRLQTRIKEMTGLEVKEISIEVVDLHFDRVEEPVLLNSQMDVIFMKKLLTSSRWFVHKSSPPMAMHKPLMRRRNSSLTQPLCPSGWVRFSCRQSLRRKRVSQLRSTAVASLLGNPALKWSCLPAATILP